VPGTSNLRSCIVSMCNMAPGSDHSKRLVVCLGAERRRCEQPWRLRTFQIVDWR
jgi:hypothetical protein